MAGYFRSTRAASALSRGAGSENIEGLIPFRSPGKGWEAAAPRALGCPDIKDSEGPETRSAEQQES